MSHPARWNDPWVDDAGNLQPALKHVKENVGSTLNKALEALEEENADALQDVLRRLRAQLIWKSSEILPPK